MSSRQHPRLMPHYSVVPHSPDLVELRFGVWNATSIQLTDESASGRLAAVLLRLDGSRSVAELARELSISRSDIEKVLDQLRDLGALDELGTTSALDYYVDFATPALSSSESSKQLPRPVLILGDPAIVAELSRQLEGHLGEVPVSAITSDDPVWSALRQPDSSWLRDGLRMQERLVLFQPWRHYFILYVASTVDPSLLRVLNRVCLELSIPWLHGALDGPFVMVGPLFVPGRSSCYECLETRVVMTLRESANYQRYKRAVVERQVKFGRMPLEAALAGLLSSHLALEAINYSVTGSGFTFQKVLSIHIPTMEISFNEVLRVPGCAACAPLPERDEGELFFDVRELLMDKGEVMGAMDR